MTASPTKSVKKGKNASPKSGGVERIFFVPDIHAGDSDPKAIALARQICEAYKPDRIIYLGDILDSGWASSYPQNMAEIPGQLERELKEWADIRKLFSKWPAEFVPGNHDYRIVRWSWNQPALFGFQPLSLESLIELPIIKAGYLQLSEGNFTVTHGACVRKWSGQSAKAEMEKWGTGGISGHTHRGATYFQRDGREIRSWTESGHLQKNPPRYAPVHTPGPMNWAQGVSTGEFGGDRYNVEFHPFTLGYRCSFKGIWYRA